MFVPPEIHYRTERVSCLTILLLTMISKICLLLPTDLIYGRSNTKEETGIPFSCERYRKIKINIINVTRVY